MNRPGGECTHVVEGITLITTTGSKIRDTLLLASIP